MDLRGDSLVDPHDYFDSFTTKGIVNKKKQTKARKTDVNFVYSNRLSSCPLSVVDASQKL